MKKAITRTYEAVVCDTCGREEDLSRRVEIARCSVCGKDVCTYCEVHASFFSEKNDQFTRQEKSFCKTHLPLSLIEVIT